MVPNIVGIGDFTIQRLVWVRWMVRGCCFRLRMNTLRHIDVLSNNTGSKHRWILPKCRVFGGVVRLRRPKIKR